MGKRVRGRKAVGEALVLIAGLPRYGDHQAWGDFIDAAEDMDIRDLRAAQHRISRLYTAAAAAWLMKRAPGCRIEQLALHQDEAAPHGHLLAVLADEQKRVGWNWVCQGLTDSRKKLKRGALMSAIQDCFHADVASKFGLERGTKGSTAVREEINRVRGAQLRAEEEEAELERLRAEVGLLNQAQKTIEDLKAERDQARAERDKVQVDHDKSRGELKKAGAERDEAQGKLKTVEADRDRLKAGHANVVANNRA